MIFLDAPVAPVFRSSRPFEIARAVLCFVLYLSGILGSTPAVAAGPTRTQVDEAMRRATDFMMNEVASYGGGFLWVYSADLKTERFGELPARETQVWVEPPSTPDVGRALVEAYRTTGDKTYLEYADLVARVLIWGQLPTGGWQFFIDFDPEGTAQWYQDVGGRSWGWEEFYHYYDNANFDDDICASPIRFLLNLYDATRDVKYRKPLLKALDFVLHAQYPNGAWPQRYPLRFDFPKKGRLDYTHFYTFNDGVISRNIHLLLKASRVLGDLKYQKAARRGMDFYLISQLGEPQAGWAQQYTMDMKPGWGRSYEPAGVHAGQTVENIEDLLIWYRITGDRRYLNPIPRALDWLESARLEPGHIREIHPSLRDPWGRPYSTDPEDYTHAHYYEMGSNHPIYVYRSGTGVDDERYWTDHEPFKEHYYPMGRPWRPNLDALRAEYDRVRALSREEARLEYEESLNEWPRLDRIDVLNDFTVAPLEADQVAELIGSLDERGAWVTEALILDRTNFLKNPPRRIEAVVPGVYVANMYRLIDYRNRLEEE